MSFENDAGFATLERKSGGDRSFLLQPVACRQGRGAGEAAPQVVRIRTEVRPWP